MTDFPRNESESIPPQERSRATDPAQPKLTPARYRTLLIVAGVFIILVVTTAGVALLLMLRPVSGSKSAVPGAATPQTDMEHKLAEEDQQFLNASRPEAKIDDAFWLNLDRRNVMHFRQQLREAPEVLVVRSTHYNANQLSSTGIGAHYGWLDGRLANLCVGFQELVSYGYANNAVWDSPLMTRTEFPAQWHQGRLGNQFDVIDTLRTRPVQRLQAAVRQFLRDQFGLAWHSEMRPTEALAIRVKTPAVLASKLSSDFAQSRSIAELACEWEHLFGKPVLDETGSTNRYQRSVGLIPACQMIPQPGNPAVYVGNPNRTTDLQANNVFLAQYGLELVKVSQPMEWLVMDHVKKRETPKSDIQIVLELESPDPGK